MALFELTDLAAYLQQDVDTASATIARTMATGVITAHTNQLFEAATYTHLLPISSGLTIRLPQRPVTDVTSVTVDATLLVSGTDWDWDGIGDTVALDAFTPADADEWQATVVYDAGFATVPAAVQAVALDLAAQLYSRSPGVTSESVDDYRVQYAATSVGLTDTHTRILRRYKQRLGSIVPVRA